MAPNTKSSTKKGGGKKGESKTGAAVRALDDDEEDKIQVEAFRFFSLSCFVFYSQEEHDFDDDDFLSSLFLSLL